MGLTHFEAQFLPREMQSLEGRAGALCADTETTGSKLLISHVLHSRAVKAQLRSRSQTETASSFLAKGEKPTGM